MERIKNLWHKKSVRRLLLILTVLLFVCLIAVQPLLSYGMQQAAIFPDLTEEGLYTVSDALVKTLENLSRDITITFCAAPDYLLGNTETRAPYIACKKLAKKNPHIKLEIRDVMTDPSAADAFKNITTTENYWNDIIFSVDGEFRRVSALSFWGEEEDEIVSYNGEYRIATEILSLTAFEGGSYAYFAVGHGERFYVDGVEGSDNELSAFYELMRELGLKVATLNLDEIDEVPENCALLIFCGTKTDYDDAVDTDFGNRSAISKIDEYLERDRSMMVFRDAYGTPLPVFDGYLEEWGLGFGENCIIAPETSLASTDAEKKGTHLIATYAPAEESTALGYGMIAGLSDMTIPPKTVLPNCASLYMTRINSQIGIGENTSRTVSGVFFAGEDAYAVDKNGFKLQKEDDSYYWLAAAAAEMYLPSGNDNTYFFSYVFAAGTTALVENAYLADSALGNRDAMRSVLRTISRVDIFADSELGGFDLNSDKYGGQFLVDTDLSEEEYSFFTPGGKLVKYPGLKPAARVLWVLVIAILPLVVLPLAGIFVCQRRKNK
ncbi:MAG: Gldg family protein [Clostridia bacterium]|nr:Gldg family protein [Clostridia bacterium]